MSRAQIAGMVILVACGRQSTPPPAPAPPAPPAPTSSAPTPIASAAPEPTASAPKAKVYAKVLRSAADVLPHVGEIVTLEGTVDRRKQPTLLGVDVNDVGADGHDPRGKRCRVTGRLEKTVVTQAEIDSEPIMARRGAGTYYAVIGDDGYLAAPVPLPP